MKKPTRFYSTKQEEIVAKVLNGKRTSNSGATAFDKGDVKTDRWLIECKTSTTQKKQFTIYKEWLIKNIEEAFSADRRPVLCFDFGPIVGRKQERYYIITEKQFQLFDQLLQKEDYNG